jgi:hypothetical protein
MRDTSYAQEIATASVTFPSGSEARIERLLIKESQQEEIRFSWWKDNRMMLRPLDLPENELLILLKAALQENVFSESFLKDLHEILK